MDRMPSSCRQTSQSDAKHRQHDATASASEWVEQGTFISSSRFMDDPLTARYGEDVGANAGVVPSGSGQRRRSMKSDAW